MKKYLLCVSSAIFTLCGWLFVSCNTPIESVPKNPLAGTLWSEKDDYPTYVEFTESGRVSLWGQYTHDCEGDYVVQGNTVKFYGLSARYYDGDWQDVYTDGTFTNNTLRINYYTEYIDDDNDYHKSTKTLTVFKQ